MYNAHKYENNFCFAQKISFNPQDILRELFQIP